MLNKIPIWAWFTIPTIVIVIIGSVILTRTLSEPQQDSNRPEEVSQTVEGVQEFELAGRNHIAEGTKATDFNSNPPTSGQHWPAPANNDVYDQPLPDERVIHNLEHGYIWISYKPDISPEIIENLKNIVNEDDWKIIMSPRAENDSQIALAAWGRLLKMDSPDYDKVKAFIKAYRNRGAERTPD